MFIENKYYRVYMNLVALAQNRTVDGYTENHHIIPRSCGGSNDPSNMIPLTFREHVFAHKILTKITTGNNKRMMEYAHRMMHYRSGSNKSYHPIKTSDETRGKISTALKNAFKTNPAIRENLKKKRAEQKMGKHSDDTKKQIKESNDEFWKSDKSTDAKRKISETNKGKQYALGSKRSDEFKENLRLLKQDKTIFSFHNVKTSETFTGTRSEFCKAYNVASDNAYNITCGKVLLSRAGWELK